jgi:hypothetical protein
MINRIIRAIDNDCDMSAGLRKGQRRGQSRNGIDFRSTVHE